MRARRLVSLIVVAAGVVALVGVREASPARAALQGDVQISGHGYGHGRGLSQWGARGYAVDYGWGAAQILDHYYGGTVSGSVANVGIGVELLSRGGRDVAVTGPALTVQGTLVDAAVKAVLVHRNPSGTFKVLRSTGCAGPWTGWLDGVPSGFVVANGASAADPANHVQICDGGQVIGYRGDLQMVNTGTSSAVVNRLPVEDYLRGVVPREMPASWADLGGGKGAQALRSQAVAARSYAISSPRNSYATTCDTTTCQVYGGEYTRAVNSTTRSTREDPRADAAIAATAGLVRKNSGGTVMRTEFSSSTGGWTAGGTFPAVEDKGDATGGNSNHNWAVAIDAGRLAGMLGTPAITGISVTERNGLGADGGRVKTVVVDTTGGSRTFTGSKFRSLTGLKSDWFKFNVRSYTESLSFTKAVYTDVLGRSGAPSELSSWAGSLAAGTQPGSVGRSILMSTEHLNTVIAGVYAGALKRGPDLNGYRSWGSYLRSGKTYNDLAAAIYGSSESLQKLGGGDVRVWVDGLYRGLLGRGAGASERASWAAQAATRGRAYVAITISKSLEARQRRVNGYYTELMQRGVDSAGLQTWVPLLLGNGDVDVQVSLISSEEYWNRAGVRFP